VNKLIYTYSHHSKRPPDGGETCKIVYLKADVFIDTLILKCILERSLLT